MDPPRQLQPTERLTITLEAQQWNQVLQLLNEVLAPRRVTEPLVQAIAQQCQRPHTAELHELPMRGVQQATVETPEEAAQ